MSLPRLCDDECAYAGILEAKARKVGLAGGILADPNPISTILSMDKILKDHQNNLNQIGWKEFLGP
jgi:hypothetical protein